MYVYFVDIFKYLIGLWVCDYKFYLVFVLKNKYINIGIYKYRNIFLWDMVIYLYFGFYEVEFEGQGFFYEYVRVVIVLEGLFQFFQLLFCEIGLGLMFFGGCVFVVFVVRIYKEYKINNNLFKC